MEVDYHSLALEHGGIPLVDYDTLARKFGGIALSGKPVHHATNDVEDLRASAEKQAPKIGNAVSSAVANVPGAKLEAVRDSKDTDRIEDKAERQNVQPSQIADIAAAKVTAPDQPAAEQVLQNLHKELPVEKAEGAVTGEPQNNAVRQVQAVVDTKAPAEEPVKKAEVLIQTPEMHAATEDTHSDYRQAQELRAQGKEAEAAELDQKIAKQHEAAEQSARARQEEANAIQKPSTTGVLQRPQEETGKAGSERGRVEPSQQGQEVAAARPEAARQEEKETRTRPGQAPKPPGSRGVSRLSDLTNLRDQTIQVRDSSGNWKTGRVDHDSITDGLDRPRRLRGVFEDGTKFNNVKIQDVRKGEPHGRPATAPTESPAVSREVVSGANRPGKETDLQKEPTPARPDQGNLKSPAVGVDFDGTLFKENPDGSIGKPIPERIASLKQDIADGKKIVIESRRAAHPGEIDKIQTALESAGLPRLPVTAKKDASSELIGDKEKSQKGVTLQKVTTNANTPLPAPKPPRKSQSLRSSASASIGHKEAFQLAKDKLGKGAKWEDLLREAATIQAAS